VPHPLFLIVIPTGAFAMFFDPLALRIGERGAEEPTVSRAVVRLSSAKADFDQE
jgi:hypothetical protein